MFVSPVPRMCKKLLTGKVGFLNTLLCKSVYYLCFCCNRGMVGTRNPAGILAFHACPSYQNVLDGVVKHVAHMQHTCYVWRRNDDGIWFAAIGF